jgi:uncharacterized protein (TIGR02444 family)
MGGVANILQQKMNITPDPNAESGELWSFSLAFYERPGVAAALIALQDGAGLDVNLILFAIWHGLSGRGPIDQQGVKAADWAVRAIRVELIEPLRALRRRLKAALDADIQQLRERVKMLEVDAERAAQTRLAALARPPFKTDPPARIADAEANLALYLGVTAASGPHAVIIRHELRSLARDR